jgi:hypothetical protein
VIAHAALAAEFLNRFATLFVLGKHPSPILCMIAGFHVPSLRFLTPRGKWRSSGAYTYSSAGVWLRRAVRKAEPCGTGFPYIPSDDLLQSATTYSPWPRRVMAPAWYSVQCGAWRWPGFMPS